MPHLISMLYANCLICSQRRKRKQKRVYDKESGKARSKTTDSKPSAVKVKQEKIEYVDEDCDEFGKDGEHKTVI